MEDIHPDVINQDLVDIASAIAVDDVTAAKTVVDTIQQTFRLLARHPGIGTLYHPARRSLTGIRMIPVEPYRNYLIFYRPLPGNIGVRILYVLHGARDIVAFIKEHRRR